MDEIDTPPPRSATQPLIRVDSDLVHPQVIALLEEHLSGMRAESPPECVYALDLNALRQPKITFLTAWCSNQEAGLPEQLMACGALKELSPHEAEIKSMRTSACHLRQGAAQALLTELLTIARQRRYSRVSLETGSTPGFDAAIAMYRRFGFVECGPFSNYREDPFSRFMSLEIAPK